MQCSTALVEILSAPNRVLTGRPLAMQGVHSDACFTLLGFSDNDKQVFVERFLARQGISGGAANRLRYLVSYCTSPNRFREMASLTQVPINLLLLCHVLSSEAEGSQLVVKISDGHALLTNMYGSVYELLTRRFSEKLSANVCSYKSQASAVARDMFGVYIPAIAFESYNLPDRLVIPGTVVDDCCKLTADPARKWDLVRNSFVLRRLGEDSDRRCDCEYVFLHSTLQEYFASRRMLDRLLPDSVEELTSLEGRRDEAHYELVWLFLAGLLAVDGSGRKNRGIYDKLVQLWQSVPDTENSARVWAAMSAEGKLWRFGKTAAPPVTVDFAAPAPPVPSYMGVRDVILVMRVEFADGDAFQFLPDFPPPTGGSAHSKGMYRYVGTPGRPGDGKVYFGKAMIKAKEEFSLKMYLPEVCGNEIYRHFGCHAQHLILSDQPWRLVSHAGQAAARSVAVNHGIHLMCKLLNGFTEMGSFANAQLQSAIWPPFPSVVIPTIVKSPSGTLRWIPIVGIGIILAVAQLLNDNDCIGNTGENVGYTVDTDPDTNAPVYAKAIKIDPGKSLSEYSSKGSGAVLKDIALGVVRVSFVESLYVESLPLAVKKEYLRAVSSICDTSDDILQSLLRRPGMQLLFPDDAIVHKYVRTMIEIRDSLSAKYREAITGVPLPPATSADLLSAIKTRYLQQVKVIDPVTGDYFPVDDRFVNLSLFEVSGTPVEELEYRSTPPAIGGRAVLVNSLKANPAKKTAIAVEDMFLKCRGPTNRVNIIGGAGIGKSTCCQSIVSRWAAGQLFNEFNLVVLVPLRRLTSRRYPSGDSYSVIDVIIQECLGLQMSPGPHRHEDVTALYKPESTLFILDGYDEIVGQVPDQLSSVFEGMISSPNRILTGRPHAMGELSGVLKGDVDIQVAGFTDANIEEFVIKFGGPAALSGHSMLQQLRRSRLVGGLARVPLNLMLLCHVFADAGPVFDDMSLTELYSRVGSLMGRRYYAKLGKDVTTLTTERQSELVTPVFYCLSEIAYQAIKAGVVIIRGLFIALWLISAYDVSDALWTALKTSGMLMLTDGDVDDPLSANFHFSHSTLHEYFAAKRIVASLCGDFPLPVADMDWLRTHKYDPRLESMWCFVGGLVGCSAHNWWPRYTELFALADIWTSEPNASDQVYERRIWLKMIEEGRLARLPDGVRPAIVDELLQAAAQAEESQLGPKDLDEQ